MAAEWKVQFMSAADWPSAPAPLESNSSCLIGAAPGYHTGRIKALADAVREGGVRC